MLHPLGLRCTLLSYTEPYWAKLRPPKVSCTLVSYAELFWAPLHSTKLCCTLYELRCTLYELRWTLRAKLHPSELSCTLLSYAAPYWATLDHNWATLHPKKYIPPPHRSFDFPFGKINIISEIPVEKIYHILCPFAVYYLRYGVRPLFTISRNSFTDGKRAG
jgi:hypothetical protein